MNCVNKFIFFVIAPFIYGAGYIKGYISTKIKLIKKGI